MPLISHRGAKGLADENTIASIQTAAQLGVEYIEFDIQHTSDKRLVLFHNDKTRSGKSITDTSFDDLVREYPNIAELADALKACGESIPLVEIKTLTTAQLALPLLKKHHGVAVTSFVTEEIEFLKKELPNSQLFIMQHKHPFGIIKKAKRIGATGIGLNKNWTLIIPHYYWHAGRNGLETYTFTINTPFVAALYARVMPNMLICTDYPNKLQKLAPSLRLITLLGALFFTSIVFEIILVSYRRFAL